MEIIKHEEIKNILLIPSYLEALSGLLLHWITKKPLIVYLFDIYYSHNRFGPGWSTLFMRLMEPVLLRSANTIIVTGEPTQKYYKNKYNVDSIILPHSVDLERYKSNKGSIIDGKGETRIVFTGEVSVAQLDSIRNMIETIDTFNELKAVIVIVANTSKENLESLGIKGSNVIVTHANREEIPLLQQGADILFLPLSFNWQNPEIIKTASPSKMPEYLAAGRPILVHAPSYSYVANYARQEGFGLVVDKPDTNLLRQAILDLKTDAALRNRLVASAKRTARKHDSVRLSKKLHSFLG